MEMGDPYRTLVAVILSARTRDEQVLKLLPELFKAFPTVEVLAQADESLIRSKISTIGMYKQKARNIKKMALKVVEDFGGRIPSTMDELVSLPGVGRKTASVMLVSVFHKPAIAVDTHVHRVTNRLGWVKTKTPEKTEAALLKGVPKKLQHIVNRVFVPFGRLVCISGKPRCWACPIAESCSFKGKNLEKPKNAEEVLKKMKEMEERIEEARKRVVGGGR